MSPIAQPPSFFHSASRIPPDAIFEVTKNYLADTDPRKVNVGAGTYRDENGKPWILPAVRMAKEMVRDCGHEYLPIAGLAQFRESATELAFHDTSALREHRIAACQSLSGTGALHLAGLALQKINGLSTRVYITSPTWSNHELLFTSIGFPVSHLPYYKNGAFDFHGYMSVLESAEPGSIVVLHACAHNPTGCDPSPRQWRDIGAVVKGRRLFPIFDAAYLGFNSGSVDADAWAIRYFVEELQLEVAVCLSFAKNMGLYGERTGLVAFVTQSAELAATVHSVLENVQRATVSSPPVYGAQIVSAVLRDPVISKQWAQDLVTMSSRIRLMRVRLYEKLVELRTPGDWSHIVKQSGMFGYTGLSSPQIKHLQSKYHIYMADTSRISIAGLNESNVEYFASAIDATVRLVD